MCGRFAQYRPAASYVEDMAWDPTIAEQTDALTARYNVAPGSHPYVLHQLNDAACIEPLHWGYLSEWARNKGRSMAINATLEKADSFYWRSLWAHGRIIVPADGWYEWRGAASQRQPWYIRLKTDRPLYMAAVTNFNPALAEQADGTGFVIITAAAEAGLREIHDRCPLVLSGEDAKLWLDLSLPRKQAEELARNAMLSAAHFDWYAVSTDVNRAGNNDARFITPALAK